MSDDKRYTEREVILRERRAFTDGAYCWMHGEARLMGRSVHSSDVLNDAVHKFPLPKITRPRVVVDSRWSRREFRVVDGQMQTRDPGEQWHCLENPNVNARSAGLPIVIDAVRVALWADLIANPTEEIEDAS